MPEPLDYQSPTTTELKSQRMRRNAKRLIILGVLLPIPLAVLAAVPLALYAHFTPGIDARFWPLGKIIARTVLATLVLAGLISICIGAELLWKNRRAK